MALVEEKNLPRCSDITSDATRRYNEEQKITSPRLH